MPFSPVGHELDIPNRQENQKVLFPFVRLICGISSTGKSAHSDRISIAIRSSFISQKEGKKGAWPIFGEG
jgi:hypothetical protein